jgi:putative Mg2+ transporter-C (MgtC) family protein
VFGLTDAELALATSMLIKLGIGALLAGLVGLERELRDHPAGIRTHILLVLGVILFSEASKGYGGGDPSRVAAQIVTGVGFLCAGTILRTGTDVKGLTTSASLWATAGIGVAVSLGGAFMAVGVVATVLCIATLSVVAKVEKRFFKMAQTRTLKVTLADPAVLVSVLQQIHLNPSSDVSKVVVEKKEPETEVLLHVRGGSADLLGEILALDGVRIANLL